MLIDLSMPVVQHKASNSKITIDLGQKPTQEIQQEPILTAAAATLPANNLVRLPPEEKLIVQPAKNQMTKIPLMLT